MGTVRFGRSGRLGFPQGAHRGEKGGACGHEGVECVDTHLHLTRIFLPRRSLSTTSIMRAVAYPSGCVEGVAPTMATSTFCHQFPEISTEPIAKRSSQRSGSATSSARDHHADPKRPAAHRAAPRVPPGRPRAGDRVVQSDIRVPQQVRARPPAGVIPVKNAPIQSGVQTTTHPENSPIIPIPLHPSPTSQVRPERVLAHRVPGGIQRRVPAGLRLRHVTRPRRHGVRRDQLRSDADGMRTRGVLLVQGRDVDDIAGRRAEARDGGCTGGERLQGRRRGGRNQLGIVHQRRVQLQGVGGDGEDLLQRSHVRGLLLVPGRCRGAGVQGELRGHHGGWRGDAKLAVVLVYHIVAGRVDDDGLNIKLKLR